MKRLLLPVAALALAGSLFAQAPPGYYNSVDSSTPATLRSTLHAVIDDHVRFSYTSSSTDTWDILELAMEDPSNSSRIVEVYKNQSHAKQGGGNSFYNREHTWPKSYGFPDDNSSNYPYTDCHQLFLCDPGYNSARSNRPFRTCSSGCAEYTTALTNGTGGGSGPYPGNSNWGKGSFTAGSWEVWGDRRGDIARAIFYMDIRYEGGNHGTTGHNEPDLIVTDIQSLISNSNTGNNESIAYMGMKSVLLAWHFEDPVDARDIARNDVVAAFQGNRNPFVDHPEWVDALYGSGATSQIYGCGMNPADSLSVLSGTPRIGQSVVLGVDNPAGTQNAGAIPVIAPASTPAAGYPCGVAKPGWGMSGPSGELLISLAPPNPLPLLFGAPWAGPGTPAGVSVSIPNTPSLVGSSYYFQGLMFDPTSAVRFGLTNAIVMTFGS